MVFDGPTRHASEGGYSLRNLRFEDRLSEKSVVVGRATNGDIVRIVADSLNDAASFRSLAGGDLRAEMPLTSLVTIRVNW